MAGLDDELRSILAREARHVPMRHDAPATLAALEPALRRVAYKRAAIAGACALALTGGTVAAFTAVRGPDDSMSVDAPDGATLPPVTPETAVVDNSGRLVPGTVGPIASDPGAAPQIEQESTTVAPGSAPTPGGEEVGDTTSPPAASSPAATTPRPEDTEPPPVATAAPPPLVPPAPTTTVPTTVTNTVATTRAPTTSVASGLTTYETPCGTIVADLAVSPPRIIEITPTGTYRAVVEDPDEHGVTVHLVGGGEDCEVHVGRTPSD